ncbi:MAG: chemotaxis protein CheD [Paracoccaceae bacterium]
MHAVEVLINGLVKVKLFARARLSTMLSDTGQSKAAFARSFLADEDVPCRADSLGGNSARRVLFRPVTGLAQQMPVPETNVETPVEAASKPSAGPAELELF